MLNKSMQSLLYGLIAICTFAPALAQTSIRFVDQTGQPVNNVVLEIFGPLPARALSVDRDYVMDQVDFQFSPRVLIVPEGAEVRFPNSDDSRHHVYSFSRARPFEIELYSGNQAEPISFDQSGIVALGCNIHDRMSAHIIVTDSDWSETSDSEGLITLPELPDPSASELRIWHAQLGDTLSIPAQRAQSDNDVVTIELAFTLVDVEGAEDSGTNTLRNRLKSFKQNDG